MKKPAPVDPALVEARKQEAATRVEERSREMARSATREIARSERRRSEEALKNWRGAVSALKQANVQSKPPAQLAALLSALKERSATRKGVTARLFRDTDVANQASRDLFVLEYKLRDKMAATRTVEITLLESKIKAEPKNAVALKRQLYDLKTLKVMEMQQWAAIRRDTAEELVEQSGDSARIAKELAAVETDAAHIEKLMQFARKQTEEKNYADKIVAQAKVTVADLGREIHTLRSVALGGLKPLAADKWDYAKARHLLVRAGFGGTPQQIEKLHAMGLYGAVDHLVEFYRQPSAGSVLHLTPPLSVDPLRNKMKIQGRGNRSIGLDPRSVEANQLIQVRRWWLQRLVESPRPLQEKLTLFWHSHFASQHSVVQSSYSMLRQNQFFREHAAGNFGGLLYGIVHDPAMIRYLDNNKNAKGNPNENLAREIMELFSMGVDQGYTEQDIVEAARALTGYNFDHATGTYRFLYNQHDTTEKTIFGKKGLWTGDDLVRLILERPETSRFHLVQAYSNFSRTWIQTKQRSTVLPPC